jgi:hypothetical protein
MCRRNATPSYTPTTAPNWRLTVQSPQEQNIASPDGVGALYGKQINLAVMVALGMSFGIFTLLACYGLYRQLARGDIWFHDFFALWSFAKFSIVNPIAQIYDNPALLEFQMDLGACPKCLLPYAYPPFLLFWLFPLGFMPYIFAYVTWSIFTLAIYLVASFHRRERRYGAFLILFAPATIMSLLTGQTGLLSSALIIGGFRLVTNRPILSGTLFGLASFKPQLGILIPIALISARLWRTAAAAGLTIVALVVASGIAFGWSIWPLWLAKLPTHADWVLGVRGQYNPTITSNLISIGVDVPVARAVQACVAVLVAVIIWVCFRGGVTILATAALLAGTFLAAPYAIFYDMPMLTNAVYAVRRDADQKNRTLTLPEIVIIVLTLILPVIMIATWRLSLIRSIPPILLFGLIVWRMFGVRRGLAKQGAAQPRETVGI